MTCLYHSWIFTWKIPHQYITEINAIIAALFPEAESWDQPKEFQEEWLENKCARYTINYFCHKDKIILAVGKRMPLEIILVTKLSQP